jgi:hypothetical protein
MRGNFSQVAISLIDLRHQIIIKNSIKSNVFISNYNVFSQPAPIKIVSQLKVSKGILLHIGRFNSSIVLLTSCSEQIVN